MREFVLNMPDVGEGVAEAELVEWHVKPGDPVREDMVLAAVMTDKATVEIPSPVAGTVRWLAAEVGALIAVKAPLVRIEVADDDEALPSETADGKAVTGPDVPFGSGAEEQVAASAPPAPAPVGGAHATSRPLAAPAVRRRAETGGIDLTAVPGTGPDGRITHEDLDLFLLQGARQAPAVSPSARRTAVEEVRITGLRRRIAERMTLSASRIPHITYVEEIDVTALEELRTTLNAARKPEQPRLTILPFLMRALVKAVEEQPAINATFDDEAGVIARHAAVHIGIATQTPGGLSVPVVRHAEARDLWDCAAELTRVTEAARNARAVRDDLSGSTITISSLGSLGGLASTPIINHPEVAIVGVNKIATRPVWDGRSQFVPRKMMNLSSSFDHRVIDGWDAATFIQRLRGLLETPALIFMT